MFKDFLNSIKKEKITSTIGVILILLGIYEVIIKDTGTGTALIGSGLAALMSKDGMNGTV